MREFEGVRALVTGGGAGIGAATARLLAERGAAVAVLDLDPAAAVASGRTAWWRTFPTTQSVRAAVTSALNCSADSISSSTTPASARSAPSRTTPTSEWHLVFDVNVLGIVRDVPRRAAPPARISKAAIVNTCSIAATAGLPQRALYSATKGAVLSLTLAMAADHVREGIRVNCVNPGNGRHAVGARLLDAADDPAAERAALNARQPMGRLVTADEVAAAIAYLASPLAASVTGTALAVDGGMAGLRLRPAQ